MPKMSKEAQAAFNDLMGKFVKAVPSDQAQKMITHGLTGAAAGALGLGGAAWLREKDKDEDERASVLLPMLAGAIGGGTAGAAIGYNRGEPKGPTTGQANVDVPITREARERIARLAKEKAEAYANSPLKKVKDFIASHKLSTGITGAGIIGGAYKVPAGVRSANVEARHNYLKANPLNFDPMPFIKGIDSASVDPAKLNAVKTELSLLNRKGKPADINPIIDDLIRKHSQPGDPIASALHNLKNWREASYDIRQGGLSKARPTFGAKVRGGLRGGRAAWYGTAGGLLGDLVLRQFTKGEAAPAAETK